MYLVNVFLVRFLAERVTIIDVGNALEHFPDLLRKVQISGCQADSDLFEDTRVSLYFRPLLLESTSIQRTEEGGRYRFKFIFKTTQATDKTLRPDRYVQL